MFLTTAMGHSRYNAQRRFPLVMAVVRVISQNFPFPFARKDRWENQGLARCRHGCKGPTKVITFCYEQSLKNAGYWASFRWDHFRAGICRAGGGASRGCCSCATCSAKTNHRGSGEGDLHEKTMATRESCRAGIVRQRRENGFQGFRSRHAIPFLGLDCGRRRVVDISSVV